MEAKRIQNRVEEATQAEYMISSKTFIFLQWIFMIVEVPGSLLEVKIYVKWLPEGLLKASWSALGRSWSRKKRPSERSLAAPREIQRADPGFQGRGSWIPVDTRW